MDFRRCGRVPVASDSLSFVSAFWRMPSEVNAAISSGWHSASVCTATCPLASLSSRVQVEEVPALLLPPDGELESLPVTLADSLERHVNDAYLPVCNNSIYPLGQVNIKSLLDRPRVADRSLLVKLQKSMWRQYIKTWRALLYFLYRTTRPDQRILPRSEERDRTGRVQDSRNEQQRPKTLFQTDSEIQKGWRVC